MKASLRRCFFKAQFSQKKPLSRFNCNQQENKQKGIKTHHRRFVGGKFRLDILNYL